MPIFEYKCSDCGKVSEFLENAGSKKAKECTHCGGKKLEKQLSVFAAGVSESGSKRCHGCSDQSCPRAGS